MIPKSSHAATLHESKAKFRDAWEKATRARGPGRPCDGQPPDAPCPLPIEQCYCRDGKNYWGGDYWRERGMVEGIFAAGLLVLVLIGAVVMRLMGW
jgi:hypothetical protein